MHRQTRSARAVRSPLSCGLVRAVTIVDRDLRFEEHPDPEPGDTELLVSVRAAGINNADLIHLLTTTTAISGVASTHVTDQILRVGFNYKFPPH